jgi:hypothetical protein
LPFIDIFGDDHRPKSAPQSHRNCVKEKRSLGVGAWQGGSAIAFTNYAVQVYSFKLGRAPFAWILRVT